MASTRYVQHVVVERAPALFDVPGSQAGCEDRSHDVTNAVMSALFEDKRESSGEHMCFGYRGSDRCERVLSLAGHATYSGQPPLADSHRKR